MTEQTFSSPFERFLSMREQIREELGDKLIEIGRRRPREIDHSDPDFISSGSAHAHYCVGQVDGLWLASRERPQFYTHPAFELMDADLYVTDQLRHIESLAPNESGLCIIGGVRVDFLRSRYFLLVEDLSRNKTAACVPSGSAGDWITVEGRTVRVDFPRSLMSNARKYTPEYLTPKNLLVLRA